MTSHGDPGVVRNMTSSHGDATGDVRSREKYCPAGDNGEDREEPQAESVDDHRGKLPLATDLLRVGIPA